MNEWSRVIRCERSGSLVTLHRISDVAGFLLRLSEIDIPISLLFRRQSVENDKELLHRSPKIVQESTAHRFDIPPVEIRQVPLPFGNCGEQHLACRRASK